MHAPIITSAQNPLIKKIMALHDSKGRKKFGSFIIEGRRGITTALTQFSCEAFVCTEKTAAQAQELSPLPLTLVSDALMKKLSTATTPSGLLAVCTLPDPPALKHLERGIVLAQIHDPGNMGTLIRTAAACGLRSVVIVEGCDPWAPKVIQAAAGTHAMLDLFQWTWQELLSYKKNLLLYALVVQQGQALSTAHAEQALLVIGNEAQGLPESWQNQCDALITLAMPGATESLNAAIAGAIATYSLFVGFAHTTSNMP